MHSFTVIACCTPLRVNAILRHDSHVHYQPTTYAHESPPQTLQCIERSGLGVPVVASFSCATYASVWIVVTFRIPTSTHEH